jgi:hypothetical protein
MIEIINARLNQESRILQNSPSKMGISGSQIRIPTITMHN